jgi:hypothetical protein
MAAKKHSKVCAYCGHVKTDWTSDHVIADCMWGDRPLPPGLVTVPTCGTCNGFWSLYEGYFRSVVAMMSNGDDPVVREIILGNVMGHLEHDNIFRQEILGSTKNVPVFNEDGLCTGFSPAFSLDWKRWDTVVGKIVRGMVYHDKKQPLPTGYIVQNWRGNGFWKNANARHNIDQMLDRWANMGADAGVFLGKRSYSVDDPFRRCFLLMFYQSVVIFAWTCPASEGEFPDPSHPDQVALTITDRQRQKQELKDRQKHK